MLKTMLLAAAAAGFLAAGLPPLNVSPAQAEQMTCRQGPVPGDWKGRNAYRKACKAAWKARLNPQPLPPKA